MIEFNWKIVIIVLVALVIADKALTVINLNTMKKNFPDVDILKAEKNPIARFFFQKFGLVGGTIIQGLLGIITAIIALLLFNQTLQKFYVPNSLSISLWIVIIIYSIVIGNNLFFLLKASKVVP